jgi:hypothetical protein
MSRLMKCQDQVTLPVGLSWERIGCISSWAFQLLLPSHSVARGRDNHCRSSNGGCCLLAFHMLSWTVTATVYVLLTVPLVPNSIPGAPPLLSISAATPSWFCVRTARTKLCPSYCKTESLIYETDINYTKTQFADTDSATFRISDHLSALVCILSSLLQTKRKERKNRSSSEWGHDIWASTLF